MERSEFLRLIGTGSVLASAGCLGACSSDNDPAPDNVDFTLNLAAGENVALTSVNGSVLRNKILVVRLTVSAPPSATDFTAVSSICTHQETTVNYVAAQQNFLCPNHQSSFDKNGGVLNGPATKSLRKYSTTLTGESLRVFS